MRTKIYCTVPTKGVHSFYLEQDGRRYFLFNQNYRKSVQTYYQNGVALDTALDFNKIHRDGALTNTMDKLPAYIRYIEKEYQIAVFDKTRKSADRLKIKWHKKSMPHLTNPCYSF